MFIWLMHNRKSIVIVTLIISAVSIWGISKIEVNNYILEDLKTEDPLKQEFDFFGKKFSGARPFELAIELKEGVEPLDQEVLFQLDKLEKYLVNEYGVGNIFSACGMVKNAHRTWMGGNEEYNSIPQDTVLLSQLNRLLDRPQLKELKSALISEERGLLRVTGKIDDLGSKIFKEKDAALYRWFEKEMPDAKFDIHVTGTAFLIDLNNKTLSSDMMSGLFIAFLLISLIAGLMFRSLIIIPIALIPNILPLIMIGGIMGLMGMDMKVSTSIIFTIAFGIAVDDTIHFLTNLRLQLRQGKSMIYALKRTYISTGKAIILTTLILCGGFLTLVVSDFLSTFYLGLLISLTLFFAVLADLLILPLLLLWFYKPKSNLKRIK
jgi:hypothetical protein